MTHSDTSIINDTMTPNTSEKTIQDNVIQLLDKMGYTYISRENNVKLRDGILSTVILKDILLEKLQEINSFEYKGVGYKFSSKNISRAVEELNMPLNEGLSTANQKISDKLMLGSSYEEELTDGNKKSYTLRYIDFDNIENNSFHFTEEYNVSRHITTEVKRSRRPDIVLFINGIPFAVIELKKSSINAEDGIKQMVNNQNQEEIPHLFKYIQITLAGNNYAPMYATSGTPAKFYATWEEDNTRELEPLIIKRTISKLDQTIYSLFNKERVLELIHSFIIFDKRIKKIARYPQYFAIKEILNKTKVIGDNGSRAGGLVWHTQGSGKSLTMVMFAKILKREIAGSRIIMVTDRKDLDEQIHTTFKNSEIKALRANSGRDLIEKLQSGASVITTLIHKFETVVNVTVSTGASTGAVATNESNLSDHPEFQAHNVFVLVDESHRTQGGNLHKAMKKVFPKGCYLGFTGTPLLKKDKASIAKFGGLIHKYTIDQAVKDKAVLPLLYEGRLVDQWISDVGGLDRRFEMLSRNLNQEQKNDLKQKWAKFSKIASSERRLEMIALDINEHFTNSLQHTGLKAMLATSSRYEAIKYQELFKKYGNIKTAVVISAPSSKEDGSKDESNNQVVKHAWNELMLDYKTEDIYLETVKSNFINKPELELLIVVDKLLTGFDAPCAAILYIDKQLQEHNLLQAIARVNRLYDGKDYGLIVDYRGLLGNLDEALTKYSALSGFDEDDLLSAVIDVKSEIAKVKTFYSHLQDLFKNVSNQNDQESYQVFLADEVKRKEFYELLSQFVRALKLTLSSDKAEEVLTQEEIKQYKTKMKFYSELRIAVKIRYHEEIDFGKYESEMRKLLDTFISANEVNQLTKLVNIFEEDFDKEIERVIGNNAKADTILSATAKVLQEKRAQNPNFYDALSKKIEKILQEYREGRLSDEEKLKHAKDIRTLLMSKQTPENPDYPSQISNSQCAKALYDNLAEYMTDLSEDEFIKVILNLDDIFKEVAKKPDWQHNNDVHKKIDQKIDDILYNVEKQFSIKFNVATEIINQVRSIGISNYVR